MKVFRYLIAVVVLSLNTIFAGTTGKLAGRVTDAQTGEALMGVNIIVEGTKQGAVTDMDGNFFVLNLPPGMYNIRASMIGYTTQRVEQVRIQVDLTTRQDFQLKSSATQINQEVVVTAKKEIQKDLTSSERSMQSDQIQALPVRDISSLLSMQAGVTKDAGGSLHIRGGRSSEITYMIDGVQVMDPVSRSQGISIDDQSIEELKAITGTFNAEYGGALSGVVNIVTKKGSDRFTVNATMYNGDRLTLNNSHYRIMDNASWVYQVANYLSHKSYFPGLDYFNQYGITTWQQLSDALNSGQKPWLTYNNYTNAYDPFKGYTAKMNVSGPVPGTSNVVSYFVAATMSESHGDPAYRFFMPWGMWQPVSDTVHSFQMPDGSLVYNGRNNWFSTQSKLFFNFNSISFSYGLYYDRNRGKNGYNIYVPDGGRQYFGDTYTHILSATAIFSNSTFLDFKASYYTNSYKSYLYDDPYDYRYMPNNTGDFQQYVFKPTREDNIQIVTNPNDQVYFGNDIYRDNNYTKYFSFNLDFTSQVDNHNLVKMGLSGRIHDLMRDGYNLQFSAKDLRPVVPDISSPFHSHFTGKPQEYAAYIQDKLEYDELIINLGLRYDYFNSNGNVLADPMDPQIYAPFKMDHIYKNYTPETPTNQLVEYTVAEREAFWWKKADAKTQLSPRFGLSFPISDKGVIHFSYGHFFQAPAFQYFYQNPNFWITGAGSTNLVGNSNLNAERTIMYELGLQQELAQSLTMSVTGYYRDIRDWIGSGFPTDTYRGMTYYSYANMENAVARGITLSASYYSENFNVSLDYTYSNANGSASNPEDAYAALNAKAAPVVKLITLNWDRPHNANMTVGYRLGDWQATLQAQFMSGEPYTPTLSQSESTGSNAFTGWNPNSERVPSSINVDLHIQRTFRFGFMNVIAMCDVTNLLDTKNARYVYSDTGSPDYSMNGYLSANRLFEFQTVKDSYNNPGMFSNPRTVTFGLSLSYN